MKDDLTEDQKEISPQPSIGINQMKTIFPDCIKVFKELVIKYPNKGFLH